MLTDFLKLSPASQVKFLKTEQFAQMEKSRCIEFLKEVALTKDISSKCLACTLKILRELKFQDRAFYGSFLQHPDSSVYMACKKALSERGFDTAFGFFPKRELLKKQNMEKKLAAVKNIISETDQSGEDLLISILGEDNLKTRELIVKELSKRAQIDEGKLLKQLPHSLWYVRAAIVEILGNRQSPLLLEISEKLLTDANVEVRMKLLEGLAKLDREQVKEYILRMTKDPHMRISREAKRIFAKI
ncbi:MAG: HEAT repeat domain-containing protein [Candidatus Aminicenantes bacterium]|nr:HEAT repeat domain-containing protein [Candidatus Aminicenantes bacterium]